jgi:hypothetical protein
MAILVEEPYRCTFLHAPKTGGTSVNRWLQTNFTVEERSRAQDDLPPVIRPLKLVHAPFPLAEYHLNYDLGWTFSTVRNPWDWAVSWYTYRLKTVKARVESLRANPVPPQVAERRRDFNLTFQEERLAVLEQGFEAWLRDPGTRIEQQVVWYGGADYVMRFENLVEDFEEVQNRLQCFEPLKHLNKSRPANTTYHSYYTSPDLVDLIAEKCDVDIALHNYTFE